MGQRLDYSDLRLRQTLVDDFLNVNKNVSILKATSYFAIISKRFEEEMF